MEASFKVKTRGNKKSNGITAYRAYHGVEINVRWFESKPRDAFEKLRSTMFEDEFGRRARMNHIRGKSKETTGGAMRKGEDDDFVRVGAEAEAGHSVRHGSVAIQASRIEKTASPPLQQHCHFNQRRF